MRKFNGKFCTFNVRTVLISRQIENPELRKFNGKLCTLNEQNVWFCGEIEYPRFRKFSKKLCTFYMYEMSGFAEKLNIQNCINSTGNSVPYLYGTSAEKLNIQNFVNSAGIVYIIYVRNIWICKEIEYLEIYKFNGKLCTLYVWNVWICR